MAQPQNPELTPQPVDNRSLADAASLMRANRKQRSLWGDAWRQFRRHKLAMFGLIMFTLLVLMSYLGPLFYKEDYFSPFKYGTSLPIMTTEKDYVDLDTGETSNVRHILGTDSQGQDMLARILFGGRISLAVGIVAALIAITVGTLVGAAAGFYGGPIDSFLMRFTDLFISLPTLPLLLLITFLFRDAIGKWAEGVFGSKQPGVFLLIVGVIGILAWMQTARLVRASFLGTKEKEFIEAAKSIGASEVSLIFKHILPNVMSPIIVAATLEIGSAIITESSLSFLGLGFPYEVPTWGAMLFNAKDLLEYSPHEAMVPGFFIFITVLSINFIGDGLRDALDPRKAR